MVYILNTAMINELRLPGDKAEELAEALREDPSYLAIQSRMRAAVVLCAQEIMADEPDEQSGFRRFGRALPDAEARTAVAAALRYMESVGLSGSASVLREELCPADLESIESLVNAEENTLADVF